MPWLYCWHSMLQRRGIEISSGRCGSKAHGSRGQGRITTSTSTCRSRFLVMNISVSNPETSAARPRTSMPATTSCSSTTPSPRPSMSRPATPSHSPLTPPTPRSSGPGASKRPSSRSRSCEDVKNQRLDDQSISMAAGRIFRKRQICPAVFRLGSDFPDTKSFTRVVLIPSSSASCF